MLTMSLKGLSQQVRLGCTAGERAVTQEVRFDVDFFFSKPPKVCASDRLEDAVCYAEVSEAISKVATRGEFNTVERLWRVVAESLPKPTSELPFTFRLGVHKVTPPVPGLAGGVVFSGGSEDLIENGR